MADTAVDTFEKTILGTFKSLLTSQKVQMFLLSQVVTVLVIILSAKLGIDAATVSNMLFAALAKSGIEASVLTTAHARVDAQVSAAQVHADAQTSIAMEAIKKGVLAQIPATIAAAASSPSPTTTPSAAPAAAPSASAAGAAVDPS